MQICFKVGEHIAGSGTDGSNPSKGIEIPGMGRAMIRVVSRDKSQLLFGGERNGRIVQSQRARDLILEQGRIGLAGAICQCLPKQSAIRRDF